MCGGQTQSNNQYAIRPRAPAQAIKKPGGLRVLLTINRYPLRDPPPPGVAEKGVWCIIIYILIYDTSTPTNFQVATFCSAFELVTQWDQLPEAAGCMVGQGGAGSVLEIFKIVAAYI